MTAGFSGNEGMMPEPKEAHITVVLPYRAPESVRQKALCEIFAEVLRQPRVGIDDDFFALGGRSIDGVLIAACINAAFSCQLEFTDLFDAPTVAELDRQINAPVREDGETCDVRVGPADGSAH
jgi:Phosphopantetheine attachment site